MSNSKQYYNYTVINTEAVISNTNGDIVQFYFSRDIPLKKIDKDFKRVLVHYLLSNICAECSNNKQRKDKILFCNPNIVCSSDELFVYINYDEYLHFIEKVLLEIEKVLPVYLYMSCDMKYSDIDNSNKRNDIKYAFDLVSNRKRSKSIRYLFEYAKALGLTSFCSDQINNSNIRLMYI